MISNVAHIRDLPVPRNMGKALSNEGAQNAASHSWAAEAETPTSLVRTLLRFTAKTCPSASAIENPSFAIGSAPNHQGPNDLSSATAQSAFR